VESGVFVPLNRGMPSHYCKLSPQAWYFATKEACLDDLVGGKPLSDKNVFKRFLESDILKWPPYKLAVIELWYRTSKAKKSLVTGFQKLWCYIRHSRTGVLPTEAEHE
jgi:hypothetical protein